MSPRPTGSDATTLPGVIGVSAILLLVGGGLSALGWHQLHASTSTQCSGPSTRVVNSAGITYTRYAHCVTGGRAVTHDQGVGLLAIGAIFILGALAVMATLLVRRGQATGMADATPAVRQSVRAADGKLPTRRSYAIGLGGGIALLGLFAGAMGYAMTRATATVRECTHYYYRCRGVSAGENHTRGYLLMAIAAAVIAGGIALAISGGRQGNASTFLGRYEEQLIDAVGSHQAQVEGRPAWAGMTQGPPPSVSGAPAFPAATYAPPAGAAPGYAPPAFPAPGYTPPAFPSTGYTPPAFPAPGFPQPASASAPAPSGISQQATMPTPIPPDQVAQAPMGVPVTANPNVGAWATGQWSAAPSIGQDILPNRS